jgi:signal transduction histidine kinase/CHASE1-domain containing sensor protein/ActR/RegA family two-component response regulator
MRAVKSRVKKQVSISKPVPATDEVSVVKNANKKNLKHTISLWAAVLILLTLLAGALITGYAVGEAELWMKEKLITQTRFIADSLNRERIQALSGTEADLGNAAYQRLKKQLEIIQQSDATYRFAYLMGRRPAGELFYFADGEPVESSDYSPPGQIYEEAHAAERRVFRTAQAAVIGPFTNRWGKWVSALVPIHDPEYIIYGASEPAEARALVYEAEKFYRTHGRERFLEEVAKRDGLFHQGDLYAFAYDLDMTFLAHPVKPELIGHNLIESKDWPGGTYFRKEIRQTALEKGSGWVDYEYENPVNKKIEPKTTFVLRLDDIILCAGAYKEYGSVMAAFGVDVDARLWHRKLFLVALVPIILTLLVCVVVCAGAIMMWRRARDHGPSIWMRYLEALLAAAIGILLTLFVAWLAHQNEIQDREMLFMNMAAKNIEIISGKLRATRDIEIESIARFFENSGEVTEDEFIDFVAHLTGNKAMQLWAWCPAVSASERESFVREVRARGHESFDLWYRAEGSRRVVPEKDFYYPVLYAMPLTAANEAARGYDIFSSPERRSAVEEAITTGFITATEPVHFTDEPGEEKDIRICRPVFAEDSRDVAESGIVLAVLRLDALLQKTPEDDSFLTEISFWDASKQLQVLFSELDDGFETQKGLSLSQPLAIFGRVFRIDVHASKTFLHLYTLREGVLVVVIGLVLSGGLTLILFFSVRRREQLEHIVQARTHELDRALQEVESARRTAETERKRYVTLFRENQEALLLLREHRIIDANAAALALFGCDSKAALCEAALSDLLVQNKEDGACSQESALGKVSEAMQTGSAFFIWSYERLDTKARFPAEVSLTKLEIDAFEVLQVAIRDISDRVTAEIEKEKAFEKIRKNELIALSMMEDANAARKEAEALKKQADAAYVAKSQFLANMSHEIRTPMNAILGYGKMLNKTALDEKQTDYLSMVLSGGEILLDLIDDILDVSKFEAGKLKLETVDFDLSALCLDAVNMIVPRIKDLPIETAVHIADDVPLELNGDPTKLRQLLVNLLGNAAKFTEQGAISVSVFHDSKPGEDSAYVDLRIHVKDTGIGIPSDKQKVIFQPFTQADESTTRKFGGTGLGLTICKAIADAMGGRIWVESEEGKGSDFIFTVRLARASDLPARDESTSAEPTFIQGEYRGSRVLVAEDNTINQKLMKEYLNILEIESDFVANGAEAIEKIKTGEYDMCLMDVQMPVLNGLEATMIIRSEVSKDFPIIGLSAAVMAEDKEKGYAAGMNDYLSKPIDLEELKKIIAKWKRNADSRG